MGVRVEGAEVIDWLSADLRAALSEPLDSCLPSIESLEAELLASLAGEEPRANERPHSARDQFVPWELFDGSCRLRGARGE